MDRGKAFLGWANGRRSTARFGISFVFKVALLRMRFAQADQSATALIQLKMQRLMKDKSGVS